MIFKPITLSFFGLVFDCKFFDQILTVFQTTVLTFFQPDFSTKVVFH